MNTDLFTLWRTEYGAGLGAIGFSCVTGKASLLVLTAGPGITNAITAVKQAFEESLPVIVLGVNNFSSVLNRRVGAMHEIPDSTVFFPSITCGQYKLTDAGKFYQVLTATIQKAVREHSPVYLEIASDVLMKVENYEIPESNLGAEVKYSCELTEDFIRDLAQASRPILIVGYGTVLANCERDVEKLAGMLNIPLVPTVKAVSYYQATPQNCGPLLDRILAVEPLAKECDLALVLGSSLSYLNTANNQLKFGGKIYRFIVLPH
jgi:acetolactate synthase-1/2/3 large subunit